MWKTKSLGLQQQQLCKETLEIRQKQVMEEQRLRWRDSDDGNGRNALAQDCYQVQGGNITWNLDFRYEHRSFELRSWVNLSTQLEEFPMSLGEEDEHLWTGDLSGSFSVKQLVELGLGQHHNEDSTSRLDWIG